MKHDPLMAQPKKDKDEEPDDTVPSKTGLEITGTVPAETRYCSRCGRPSTANVGDPPYGCSCGGIFS